MSIVLMRCKENRSKQPPSLARTKFFCEARSSLFGDLYAVIFTSALPLATSTMCFCDSGAPRGVQSASHRRRDTENRKQWRRKDNLSSSPESLKMGRKPTWFFSAFVFGWVNFSSSFLGMVTMCRDASLLYFSSLVILLWPSLLWNVAPLIKALRKM